MNCQQSGKIHIFQFGKTLFLDSLQFMNASLSTFVDNLKNSGNNFKYLSSQFEGT